METQGRLCLEISIMLHIRTILDALVHLVQVQGDDPSFIFRDKHQNRHVLTWNSLYTLSGRFAAILRNDGVGRGSLVANCLVNSPERMVSEIGVMMAGAATVGGYSQFADGSDLLRTIRVSRASTLLMDPDVPNSCWNVLKNHVTLDDDNNVKSDSLPDLRKVYFLKRIGNKEEGDFIGYLEKLQNWFQSDDVKSDDDVFVLKTSGTTGLSKLVVYTHGSFADDFEERNLKLILENMDTVLNLMPPGIMSSFFGIQILQGWCRVLCDIRAGIPENMEGFMWQCIQAEKCTQAVVTTNYLPRLLQLANAEKEKVLPTESNTFSVWKPSVFIFGGCRINQFSLKAGLALADSVLVLYGCTEFRVASCMRINDAQDYVDLDAGNIMKGVDVKIVSTENEEKVLPTNQLGNILVKRSQMMKGYLNDPEATAAVFTKDGFYRTGDLGRLDDRGHLIVEGRGDDAIARGVCIFYPFLIEERIRQCPGVKDVLIVGVPDPLVNEELCACLQLDTSQVTVDEVRHYVEKDNMTSECDLVVANPRYYLTFESFPRSVNDKYQRHVLKKLAAERLSLSKAQDTDSEEKHPSLANLC